MEKKHTTPWKSILFGVILLMTVFVMMLGPLSAHGQDSQNTGDSTKVSPIVLVTGQTPDGAPIYSVKIPGSSDFVPVVGDAALGQVLSQYANGVINANSNNGSPIGPSTGGNSVMDQIDNELSNILGESVSKIMKGIGDELEQVAQQLLSSVVNVSPIGEVATLKDMMKEAYSKEQKMLYQRYKLNYEEKKSQTELSTSFVNYYNALGLNNLLKGIDKQVAAINKMIGMGTFSSQDAQAIQNYVNTISNTDDLLEIVNTAINRNNGVVWMSEAQRVAILDKTKEQILKRQDLLSKVRSQVNSAYVYQHRVKTNNGTAKALYRNSTVLNPFINTLK